MIPVTAMKTFLVCLLVVARAASGQRLAGTVELQSRAATNTRPVHMAYHPGYNQLYVVGDAEFAGDGPAHHDSGCVFVIDCARNRVVAEVHTRTQPSGLCLVHGQNRLYVALGNGGG